MFVMVVVPSLVAFGKFKIDVGERLTFDRQRRYFRMKFGCSHKFVRLPRELRRIASRFASKDILDGGKLQCEGLPGVQSIYLEFDGVLRESHRFFRFAIQYVTGKISGCFLKHKFNVREFVSQHDQRSAVRRRMFMMGVGFGRVFPFGARCLFFLTTELGEDNC